MKKRDKKESYLLNRGGYPRLGQMLLDMESPEASSLGDSAYLDFVLKRMAPAMFPVADALPKIDIDTRDSEGDTVLHYACAWGDLRAVRLLVEAGADVNEPGDMDQTPLHRAVGSRFLDIIEYLLSKNALQEHKDAFGYTVLEWAKQMGYSDVISVLQQR